MAHFYLDNDTSPRLIAGLQLLGHQATHTRRVGRRYAPDDDQLIFAMANGWPIVSHNHDDYLLLHRAWHTFPPAWGHPAAPPHPGILLVAQTSPANSLAALTALLTKHPVPPFLDQLYWWDGSSAWQWYVTTARGGHWAVSP